MKITNCASIKLSFDKAVYNKRYSLISTPTSFKPLREGSKLQQKYRNLKQEMIERLPTNLKTIEISPMTKAMIGMFVSVLAMAEYLDKVY